MPVEELLAAPEIGAIEIYTGTIERFEGDPSSVDVWDWMLAKGRVVYGHAPDRMNGTAERWESFGCGASKEQHHRKDPYRRADPRW
jgi:hypothetical protein